MNIDILKVIDQNAKLTTKEIAEMLDKDEKEVAKEIASMEKDHTICGYPTLINWDKTGEERVTALIEVKVTPQRGMGFDKIAERIYKYEEVEALYLMSGGYDLTVMIVGKTLNEVAHFVASKLAPMESVVSTATHFVLKKYKQHGLEMIGEKDDERMLITP
jgi:DNA-binding Lrp family transcriptional regulator